MKRAKMIARVREIAEKHPHLYPPDRLKQELDYLARVKAGKVVCFEVSYMGSAGGVRTGADWERASVGSSRVLRVGVLED